MTGNVDNKEIIRLAGVVAAFNKAVNQAVAYDFEAQRKLQQAMTPDRQRQAQQAIVAIMVAAQQMMEEGETEALVADIAARSIAAVNMMLDVVHEAGLEEQFKTLFPAEEKTEENTQSFRALGANNIARLCIG